LRTVVFEARNDEIKITGHNLDCCTTGSTFDGSDASRFSIEEPGVAAVAKSRLHFLHELSDDAVLDIISTDTALKISCGRARLSLPTLPATDAPAALALRERTTEYQLAASDVAALFHGPPAAIADDAGRPHLHGMFLHSDGDRLSGVGTDGVYLVRATTSITGADALPLNGAARGVLLSLQTCQEIFQIGKKGVMIVTDGRLLEARTPGGACFVGKLLDYTFPDFVRAIPPPVEEAVEMNRLELIAAVERLTAASSVAPAVELSWEQNGELRLELADEPGAASDALPAITKGRGTAVLMAFRLLTVLQAMVAARLRITAADIHHPARFEPVDGSSTLGVLCAIRIGPQWRQQHDRDTKNGLTA
jgi:DNA polymerase-3 subunit beta